jgi:hypothetical protein
MVLLRFLIISILILYVVRAVLRLLLPFLFQSVVNKAQQQQQNYNRPEQPTGRIKVDYIPEGKKSNVPDSEGEFVDYEEVKK